MRKLLDWLFPKEKDFFGMLRNQASIVLKGINTFYCFMAQPSTQFAENVSLIEKEADRARRMLIDDLNRTYITPIEREDIFALSRSVDDILDFAKSAVEEFQIYKLETNADLKVLADQLQNGVKHLFDAIELLKEHPNISIENCSMAKDCIDDLEDLYYRALATLADSSNFSYMFKMREIYRHCYHIGQAIDDSANIILGIIVKIT